MDDICRVSKYYDSYIKLKNNIFLFVQNFDKIEYLKEHIEGMIPCDIILDLIVSESLKRAL